MNTREEKSVFALFPDAEEQPDTAYTLPFNTSVWTGTELPEQPAYRDRASSAEQVPYTLSLVADNFPLYVFPGGGNGIDQAISSSTYFDVRTHGSGNTHIDNLIARDPTSSGNFSPTLKWGSEIGQGTDLTYSLSTPASVFSGSNSNYGQLLALTAEQQAAIHSVMAQYTEVTGLTFTEVNDTSNSAGDIRWTRTDNPQIATASGYYPGSSTDSGDIWIGNQYSQFLDPQVGGYGYHTLLHELGHALGLNHPHESAISATPGEDQLKYSVMSYRDYDGDALNGYATAYYPTTLMINDIAALQFLYGANTTHHSGDDVYTWDGNASVFETIFDAGGNDTIDARSQADGVVLDLNPGEWSAIGKAFFNGQEMVRENLTIAYDTLIENAVGSSLDDTLIGNDAANSLDGWYGSDLLIGGNGDDTYYVDDAGDAIVEEAGGGHDRVFTSVSFDMRGIHLEDAQLSGTLTHANLTGNELDNVLIGDNGNNLLDGGAGNDVLYGGQGDDTLIGGSGADIFVFDGNLGGGLSYLQDFNVNEDTIQLSHLIFSQFSEGSLLSDYFVSGDGLDAGLDANDFLVFDSDSGSLYYDADGSGVADAVLFARFAPASNALDELSYQQFSIV